MNTKEIKDVIMFLENCIHYGEEDNLQAYEVKYNHWMKKIIILLKRGEKFEKIVNEIDEFLEPGTIFEVPEDCKSSRHIDIIKYTIKKIKQKYSPKPKTKWQKLNEIINKVSIFEPDSITQDIIKSLISLRDEEKEE